MVASQDENSLRNAPVQERIHAIICQIPVSRVATYGQIAQMEGRCTARMVGYALAALPMDTDVPWQRVINRKGKISPRTSGHGGALQRIRLEEEGVIFDREGRIDFKLFGWPGPSLDWLDRHGFYPAPPLGNEKRGSFRADQALHGSAGSDSSP